MFKLIILNNNFEAIKFFCNNSISKISELKLCGIATNLNELDNLIVNVKADILLMSYNDYIASKYINLYKRKKVKLIIYNSEKTCKGSSTKLFIKENTNLSEMTKIIDDYISNQSILQKRKEIIKILESFSFDFKLIGTTYLLESILYCYENKLNYVFENLENYVYPVISKKCHVSASNIKYAIIRAINSMNATISKDKQKQLSNNFKVDISEKTTAKQLISTVVTRL